VTVVERVPTGLHLSDANAEYLAAKVRRGAHTLDLNDLQGRERLRHRTRRPEPDAAVDE
jgi:hypothetical protein